MKLLFLLSQPRAGSTLLQKMLAAHPDITTTSECWFQLPLACMWDDIGVVSPYGHKTSTRALRDMFANEQEARSAFLSAASAFARRLYEEAAPDPSASYFLDKTPRYYHIIDTLAETFPMARFIFLFRNPLAVLASMMNAWGRGGFAHMHAYWVDLVAAPRLLVEALDRHQSRSHVVRYEQLVERPADTLERLTDFLQIAYLEKMTAEFAGVRLTGPLGDHRGEQLYGTQIGRRSIHAWRKALDSPLRRQMAAMILRRIGAHVVSRMGYDIRALQEDLKRGERCGEFHWPRRRDMVDMLELVMWAAKSMTNAGAWRAKLEFLRRFGVEPYFH